MSDSTAYAKRLSFRMTESLYKSLKEAAKDEGVSMQELIHSSCERAVKGQLKEPILKPIMRQLRKIGNNLQTLNTQLRLFTHLILTLCSMLMKTSGLSPREFTTHFENRDPRAIDLQLRVAHAIAKGSSEDVVNGVYRAARALESGASLRETTAYIQGGELFERDAENKSSE